MKNKFLLLGATALLSTGLAISSIAGEISANGKSATIDISADIIVPNTIRSVQDLSFGTIIPHNSNDYIAVDLEPDGSIVDGNGTNSITFMGDHSTGKIEVYTNTLSNKMHIVSPESDVTETLTSDDGYELTVDHIQFNHSTDEDIAYTDGYVLQTYYVGGILSGEPHNGTYTGSYTVTLVAAE